MSEDNSTNMEYQEHLQNNLKLLITNGKIGFQKFQPAYIQTKQNKFLEITKNIRNYHFCVDIPYAGKILNWEVIFDPEDYSQLPDFDFNDYSFLPEPDIDYIAENVPSWDSWDITQSGSVLKILNEFLTLYKKSQIDILMKQIKFKQIRKQYEEMLEVMEITPDQVEVFIETKSEFDYDVSNDDSTIVNFLIVLPIDFQQLPEYYQGEGDELINPGEDFVHLNIQLKKLDNSQVKISMLFSPRVEQLIGRPKIPKFKKDATLSDYAQMIKVLIEKQIGIICTQYEARNMFVLSLVDTFSQGIVEYDAVRFHKISFIYEDFENYDCLVTVQLGGKFPSERPKVQLHSLYCQVGRFCNTTVTYSYDPQKNYEENIMTLREILHHEVKLFQNHKHA